MYTNSKEGNSDNSKNLKILKINKGKNKFWPLLLLLYISTMVWITIGRETHRTICDKSIQKSTTLNRYSMNMRDRIEVMTSDL